MLKTKEIIEFTVGREDEGVRLSSFVRHHLKEVYPLAVVKKAIDRCAVHVNSRTECFSSYKVAYDDKIDVDIELFDELSKDAPKPTFGVLFEDEQLVVFDKPAHMESSIEEVNKLFPGTLLVHRLDKETSGVMILAKTELAQNYFNELFRKREVKKEYLAICIGEMKSERGAIDNSLQKIASYDGQNLWGIAPHGRGLRAQTQYQRLKWGGRLTLVRCQPKTGRTHQIRVHLKHIGYPILGDRQYAKEAQTKYTATRQMLHAKSISFIHPVTGELIRASAAIPEDFLAATEIIDNALSDR